MSYTVVKKKMKTKTEKETIERFNEMNFWHNH